MGSVMEAVPDSVQQPAGQKVTGKWGNRHRECGRATYLGGWPRWRGLTSTEREPKSGNGDGNLVKKTLSASDDCVGVGAEGES